MKFKKNTIAWCQRYKSRKASGTRVDSQPDGIEKQKSDNEQ